VLCFRVVKVAVILEGSVDHATCQQPLDTGSWFGNLVLPRFADANKRCISPKFWDPPTPAFDSSGRTLSAVTNNAFTQPRPTVEAAQGREQLRRSALRHQYFFSAFTWEEFEMNRIVLSTVAVLVAVVGFAMVGEDQQANAGLFGRKCCKPACCEPAAPVCCEPVCGGKKHCGGLFARLRAKKCCKPACCEPAPSCCEPAPTCCEPAPACGCEAAAPACGCEAAAPCGCDAAPAAAAPAPEAAPAAPEAPAAPAA
jgi:hypothetical protein